MPFPRHFAIVIIGLTFLPGLALAQEISQARREEEARRISCLEKVQTNPEEAYEDALQWRAEGRRLAARECVAAAQVALNNAARGAREYEILSNVADPSSRDERVRFLALAGAAYSIAHQYEESKRVLGIAIELKPRIPSLRYDRALALIELKEWEMAVGELDAADLLLPNQAEFLRERARVHMEIAEMAEAQSDIDRAIAIDPKDVEARLIHGHILEKQNLLRRTGALRTGALKTGALKTDGEAPSGAAQPVTDKATLPSAPAGGTP